MEAKTGLKLVEMVDDPYSFYSEEHFKNARVSLKVFQSMIEDEFHLMKVLGKDDFGFLGGYVLGYSLREKMGTRDTIEQKPKSYSYLDPVRFCQSMGLYCDELPESIEPEGQKPKMLVERFDIDGNLEHRIYVGNLAYLSIPPVKTEDMDKMDLGQLIQGYRLTRDVRYREEFFKKNEPYIRKLLGIQFLSAILASGKDIGEFENAAKRGLDEVFDRFDFSRAVKVETYLPTRVNGEILDMLRSLDKVPRLVRATIRKIQPLIENAKVNGNVLSVEQLVELTGRSKETVQQACDLLEGIGGKDLSLDQAVYENDSYREIPLSDLVSPSETKSRGRRNPRLLSSRDGVAKVDNKDFLSHIISCLPQQDQEIIVGLHLHGLTMKELGEAMQLSESRISQMHSDIWEVLQRLANRMRSDWVEK